MDGALVALITTVIGMVMGSSGFWAFIQYKNRAHDATTRLLMGLAYSEIVKRGMGYIDRGFITKDEYEDYMNYFYKPYVALGGNGVAERIMSSVSSLPFKTLSIYLEKQVADPRQEYDGDGRRPQGFN